MIEKYKYCGYITIKNNKNRINCNNCEILIRQLFFTNPGASKIKHIILR
jgi:hypothetical protein